MGEPLPAGSRLSFFQVESALQGPIDAVHTHSLNLDTQSLCICLINFSPDITLGSIK